MLINTTDIKDNFIPLDFTEKIILPEAYLAADNVSSVNVKGGVSKDGNFYVLNARMEAEINFFCALCLAPVDLRLKIPVEETFSDASDIDEAYWGFNGKIIDITPALLSNILLNLPMKVLCSDDCRGLCPVCGKDRNLSDCGCNESIIDPRWMALFEKEV